MRETIDINSVLGQRQKHHEDFEIIVIVTRQTKYLHFLKLRCVQYFSYSREALIKKEIYVGLHYR